eukprot:1157809-Pelagomonas_calceolata.AAC.15
MVTSLTLRNVITAAVAVFIVMLILLVSLRMKDACMHRTSCATANTVEAHTLHYEMDTPSCCLVLAHTLHYEMDTPSCCLVPAHTFHYELVIPSCCLVLALTLHYEMDTPSCCLVLVNTLHYEMDTPVSCSSCMSGYTQGRVQCPLPHVACLRSSNMWLQHLLNPEKCWEELHPALTETSSTASCASDRNTALPANIPAALLVLAMIVLCDVGLFGFMWWANLTFNIITFIIFSPLLLVVSILQEMLRTNIARSHMVRVIAVGISVDYSGHVARAFMIAQGTRQERAHYALKHIGGEVLNGAFTTWLAIIVLAGAKHYIFMSFFKLLFALVSVVRSADSKICAGIISVCLSTCSSSGKEGFLKSGKVFLQLCPIMLACSPPDAPCCSHSVASQMVLLVYSAPLTHHPFLEPGFMCFPTHHILNACTRYKARWKAHDIKVTTTKLFLGSKTFGDTAITCRFKICRQECPPNLRSRAPSTCRHGVVFLPVCLSLIGPASYRSESPAKDKDSTDSDSVPGTKNKEVEEGTEVVAV